MDNEKEKDDWKTQYAAVIDKFKEHTDVVLDGLPYLKHEFNVNHK